MMQSKDLGIGGTYGFRRWDRADVHEASDFELGLRRIWPIAFELLERRRDDEARSFLDSISVRIAASLSTSKPTSPTGRNEHMKPSFSLKFVNFRIFLKLE